MTSSNTKPNDAWTPTWQSTGGLSGNLVLQGEDFFVSFMPASGGMNSFSFFAADGDETALVIPAKGEKVNGKDYLILNGDYRRDYEKLVPLGMAACIKFFEKHKKAHASSWTDAA